MTKRTLSLAVAILVAVASLSVTMSAAQMNCRIPFSFIVNGKTLPAGAYSVSTENALVALKSTRAGVFVLTNGMLSSPKEGYKLVFLKTGDRYDLIEIWTGNGDGRAVVGPRKHLEERARAAGMRIERVEITGM